MRLVDILPFQKSGPKGFERICNNDRLKIGHVYLLRDRRDGFEKNDYIGSYLRANSVFTDVFVERFVIFFYKTPQETNWSKKIDTTSFNYSKYKFLDWTNTYHVPKKMINKCDFNTDKSIAIYHLFKVVDDLDSLAISSPSHIKQKIIDLIKHSIQINPELVNELPADLLHTNVVGGRRRRFRNRSKRHQPTSSIKTQKNKR